MDKEPLFLENDALNPLHPLCIENTRNMLDEIAKENTKVFLQHKED